MQFPRVALVTGAGQRLGSAIAIGLAGAGWDVAIHYLHSSDGAEQTAVAQFLVEQVDHHRLRPFRRGRVQRLGQQQWRAVVLQCDLADETGVRALPGRASAALGPLGCIVNNAALFSFDDPTAFSPALLATHMQTNVAAPLLLAQALHAATPEGTQAVVINLLDQKLGNLNPDFLSYTLSKAALHTATTMLAQALAPRVRVVGVSPGITLVSGDQGQAGFEQAHRATPLGRSSTPQDIVDAVCYLAGARAITGTTLVVDGGQHLLPLARDVMFLTGD
jgi:NAD(P)-dependent dehydrogenase (short-subunit alcohol dehydrogenase family)